jgi:hypothetical protein
MRLVISQVYSYLCKLQILKNIDRREFIPPQCVLWKPIEDNQLRIKSLQITQ